MDSSVQSTCHTFLVLNEAQFVAKFIAKDMVILYPRYYWKPMSRFGKRRTRIPTV